MGCLGNHVLRLLLFVQEAGPDCEEEFCCVCVMTRGVFGMINNHFTLVSFRGHLVTSCSGCLWQKGTFVSQSVGAEAAVGRPGGRTQDLKGHQGADVSDPVGPQGLCFLLSPRFSFLSWLAGFLTPAPTRAASFLISNLRALVPNPPNE